MQITNDFFSTILHPYTDDALDHEIYHEDFVIFRAVADVITAASMRATLVFPLASGQKLRPFAIGASCFEGDRHQISFARNYMDGIIEEKDIGKYHRLAAEYALEKAIDKCRKAGQKVEPRDLDALSDEKRRYYRWVDLRFRVFEANEIGEIKRNRLLEEVGAYTAALMLGTLSPVINDQPPVTRKDYEKYSKYEFKLVESVFIDTVNHVEEDHPCECGSESLKIWYKLGRDEGRWRNRESFFRWLGIRG